MVEFNSVAFVGSDGNQQAPSTLSVGEASLEWGPHVWSYVDIILHAMCTDMDTFPEPCIYMQIETSGDMDEIRLIPEDPNDLQAIFNEMSRCAALHSDDVEEEQNDEESDSELFDASTNAAKLQRLEAVFVEPQGMPPKSVPGQFDEIDEEDDDDL